MTAQGKERRHQNVRTLPHIPHKYTESQYHAQWEKMGLAEAGVEYGSPAPTWPFSYLKAKKGRRAQRRAGPRLLRENEKNYLVYALPLGFRRYENQ